MQKSTKEKYHMSAKELKTLPARVMRSYPDQFESVKSDEVVSVGISTNCIAFKKKSERNKAQAAPPFAPSTLITMLKKNESGFGIGGGTVEGGRHAQEAR